MLAHEHQRPPSGRSRRSITARLERRWHRSAGRATGGRGACKVQSAARTADLGNRRVERRTEERTRWLARNAEALRALAIALSDVPYLARKGKLSCSSSTTSTATTALLLSARRWPRRRVPQWPQPQRRKPRRQRPSRLPPCRPGPPLRQPYLLLPRRHPCLSQHPCKRCQGALPRWPPSHRPFRTGKPRRHNRPSGTPKSWRRSQNRCR
jgi:hypothetical protein